MIAVVALVQAAQVAIEIDTRELREGQSVGLMLSVEDAEARDAPTLAVPDGLSIAYQSASRQQTIINFQSSYVTTYRYALTALRAGRYVIGPFEVATSAGRLRTQAVDIDVGARAAGGGEGLVAELSSEGAWLGQILVYHARFTTDGVLVSGSWTPPQTDALRPESSAEPRTTEYEVQERGSTLQIREMFYPLRASRVGPARVPAAVLSAQFAVQGARRRRDFFPGVFSEVRNETYSAAPIDLEVRPLPPEPVSWSGLVGRFGIERRASSAQVAAGGTITLETTLVGDGVLVPAAVPELAGLGFKVYADQPVVHARIDEGRYAAAGTWKHAIVPLAPGPLRIPALSLVVFDTTAGAFKTLQAPDVEVDVVGSAAAAEVATFGVAGRGEVDALGDDVLPVRTDAAITRPITGRWAWTLLVPGAAALAAEGVSRVRRRPRASVERALKIGDLPMDPDARLAGFERILRERVGARLGLFPDAVRREDLAGLGAPAEAADDVWRRLETLRYGGGGGALPEAELAALIEQLA